MNSKLVHKKILKILSHSNLMKYHSLPIRIGKTNKQKHTNTHKFTMSNAGKELEQLELISGGNVT